jgi:hypothetical protein
MTDLQTWLNPAEASKLKRKTIKEMAAAYASGKTITQVSIDFGFKTSLAQKMLREYIPTQEEINGFKMKFAAKKLRAKRIKGQL